MDARSEFSREGAQSGTESPGTTMFMSSSTGPLPEEQYNGKGQPGAQSQGQARRPAKGSEPYEKWERDEMEKLLTQLNGHLGTPFRLVTLECANLVTVSCFPVEIFGRGRYRE